jgi:hypothetical protein
MECDCLPEQSSGFSEPNPAEMTLVHLPVISRPSAKDTTSPRTEMRYFIVTNPTVITGLCGLPSPITARRTSFTRATPA